MKFIFLSIAFIILASGCVQQQGPAIEVVYTLSGGLTPVDWHDRLVVVDNGNLEYELKWGENVTSDNSSLEAAELESFRALVLEADVFSLEDSYVCSPDSCPFDLPGEAVEFRIGNRTKAISLYYPENLPEGLEKILNRLVEYRRRFD